MHHLAGKRQSNPIIAAILVFAVFGTFAFLASEIPHKTELGGNMPYLTSIFTQDHIIWLAEAANVCRANRFSFSATQNGILCMLPAEIYNDGEYFAAFSIHIKSTDFSNIKNVIPQVLRI